MTIRKLSSVGVIVSYKATNLNIWTGYLLSTPVDFLKPSESQLLAGCCLEGTGA